MISNESYIFTDVCTTRTKLWPLQLCPCYKHF